jgi:hypothetical protein
MLLEAPEEELFEDAQAIETVEVDAEEHEYIDEYNMFDGVTIFLALFFAYLQFSYFFGDIDLRFTTLSQEYLYSMQNMSFEISILTLALLIKPYETVKFYNLTTILFPSIIFCIYFYQYF